MEAIDSVLIYRKLNSIMENDAYPLPNITEILESLDGSTVFSSIDLNSGYWQITMDPGSKSKTTFITSSSLFHFIVMPFGLKNAPAKCQFNGDSSWRTAWSVLPSVPR